jgi:hypothetical protein
MRALGVTAMTAMAVIALGGAAYADGTYFGIGFGGARLDGELGRVFDATGEVGGRVIGGLRWADTALEVSFFGTDVHYVDEADAGAMSTMSLGIGVKQYATLSEHVSIYGRAGLDYTWLVGGPGMTGRGYDLGTGLQLDSRWASRLSRISQWVVSAWLDAGYQRMRLESADSAPLYGQLIAVNIGFAVEAQW